MSGTVTRGRTAGIRFWTNNSADHRSNPLLGRTKVVINSVYITYRHETETRHTRDRNPTESKTGFDVQYISDGMVRREQDRIGDEAVFVPFHSADHGCL